MSITAISAWLVVAVHYFYQYGAALCAARKHPVWIRFVVVPGSTDDVEELDRMVEFAASLGNVERVDVLPFHQMGRFKGEKLGMDYQMRAAKPPSRETVNEVLLRFRAAGLKAV